jgi:hypothetical protein
MNDWQVILNDEISSVQAEITALTEQSLCEVSRVGGDSAHRIKRSEGRWIALRDLRDAADRESLIASILRNRDQLVAERTHDRGPTWDAYFSGGIEGLTALLVRLDVASS